MGLFGGGYIGLGIAKQFPERLISLIVGGATAFGTAITAHYSSVRSRLIFE